MRAPPLVVTSVRQAQTSAGDGCSAAAILASISWSSRSKRASHVAASCRRAASVAAERPKTSSSASVLLVKSASGRA
jgi:hypothetical protein